jgi:hypothetical protein
LLLLPEAVLEVLARGLLAQLLKEALVRIRLEVWVLR